MIGQRLRFYRGDIVYAELDPVIAPEQGRVRPCVVVVGDEFSQAGLRARVGMTTVVPLTRNVAGVRPFQAFLPAGDTGLPHDSKAQIEQIRSVSTDRIIRVIGRLRESRQPEVDALIRDYLDV